jgi:hypothetical protein
MTRHRAAQRVLILGGGGMVGVEVAREAVRELHPDEIIISALTAGEVDEAVAELRADAARLGWKTKFTPEPGDIFIPASLQGHGRGKLVADRKLFDELFDDIFSSNPEAYKGSKLYKLIDSHRPDVVVDCINTATAISYQDVYTTSRRVKVMLDRLEDAGSLEKAELDKFILGVRELMIAQGVPQITRHILYLHNTLKDTAVRIYVKVGTTGTGGMGLNIPYTHSEDKPSATLISKSAIGFAHTGLLFLLARTPGAAAEGRENMGTLIKEVKPGAMIGFRKLRSSHVKLAGATNAREPGFLVESKDETIGAALQPRADFASYSKFENRDVPVTIVGADTGENGFFCIGEFHAITYPRQMEYVTPEEVARTVILEILGASTGRDVLAAIDGAITEPSYRAGVLRDHACRQLEALETALSSGKDFLPSVAIGQLGPPRLSKLLFEAYLIRAATGTSSAAELAKLPAEKLRTAVEAFLAANPKVTSLVTTIGIPLLRAEGKGAKITRGPRLNIPVPRPDGKPNEIDAAAIEKYAFQGWVDLRPANFVVWSERITRLLQSKADIAAGGSAAFDRPSYMPDEFIPGEVVGWLLANEADSSGMVGNRLF